MKNLSILEELSGSRYLASPIQLCFSKGQELAISQVPI